MRPFTDLPPHPIDLPPGASQDDADRGLAVLAGSGAQPSDDVRAEIADADTRRLIRECSAVARMRDALGNYTQLEVVKRIGSWSRGGGPHISRRWVACWCADAADASIPIEHKTLVTTLDCLSPAEAVETLFKQVRERGLWPSDPAVSIGKLDGPAMAAAQMVADEDDETPEPFDVDMQHGAQGREV